MKESKRPRSVTGDSSQYSSDPGRNRSGDVANQYLYPDGRSYQEFTQYSCVRGRVDLDFANVRVDRGDTRTKDSAVEVIGDRLQMESDPGRRASNQPAQQQSSSNRAAFAAR
jgi:hypothetical protein